MQVLRTPDSAFAGLSGYDFEPHYVEVASGATAGDYNLELTSHLLRS